MKNIFFYEIDWLLLVKKVKLILVDKKPFKKRKIMEITKKIIGILFIIVVVKDVMLEHVDLKLAIVNMENLHLEYVI